jgi:CDP-diacylglycerol--serine O-phosphatidyltransferase
MDDGTAPERKRRLRLRRPRLERRAMNQLIPNVLTVCALCAGLTAVRFAFLGQWEHAIWAITIAGIFDGLDGRAARYFGGTSKFGAELDSLSDFVSFGVAPGVVIYLWSARGLGDAGWIAAMFFAVCCALRLARFNTMLGDPNPPPWARFFFVGVPAPAGAGLAVLPLLLTFETGAEFFSRPWFTAATLVLVGVLMVSRIPTFSIKQIRVPRSMILPALMVTGLIVGALVSRPWTTFVVVGVIYVASIPIAALTQARARGRVPAPESHERPEETPLKPH